ncbi:MAG: NAD(P)H-dependent oxidoreductase subunit E [Chloroflexi bacterium]|nr:NAD(P)H-dependent oxidoreductase subunit E [Chloroflexota bacterium]
MPRISSPAELEERRQNILSKRDNSKPCIAVCGGTGCHALGNRSIIDAFKAEIKKRTLQAKVNIRETGCPGFCEAGPIVVIYPEEICYVQVTPEDASDIISETVVGKKVIDRLVYTDPKTGEKAIHESEIPFYKGQMRLTIGDNGKLDPKSIEDYLAVGGYSALVKVLQTMTPEQVVAEIKKSNLRGRSGAGFPASIKWDAVRVAVGDTKYVICNCHEGDPGAFADRRMMEANPHNILEGMIIGAYAMGANEGYIFVGDEFPLTVENTAIAIKQAEEYGLLGKNILGSGLDLNIKINIDAGGYVCGEMSALMAAIEGRVGEPTVRYDHATERGLWNKPTCVNNLQTWASVPLIVNKGADWYAGIGTASSKGTRVFSLVGTVNNSGLVEVPMGMTLRQVIFDIGGGIREDNNFKAVLVGGPLGAFLPESLLDLPVDFDEISKAGGSLGPSLVVIDEKTCMVDMVKYFLTFLSNESCGKCTPCRDGIRQMLKIVNRINDGGGKEGDIELLEAISEVQRVAALCPLGQTASNPARSAIKHFRDELEVHIKEKRCPSGVCKILATASH